MTVVDKFLLIVFQWLLLTNIFRPFFDDLAGQLSSTIFQWSLSANFHQPFIIDDQFSTAVVGEHSFAYIGDCYQPIFVDRFSITLSPNIRPLLFDDCCQLTLANRFSTSIMNIMGQLSSTIFYDHCQPTFIDHFSITIAN